MRPPAAARETASYVYRVLLTGIHLMRTGKVEVNLVTLNEEFRLPYIAELVARKLDGAEDLAVGQLLDSEIAFHESEYQRLRGELQSVHDTSVARSAEQGNAISIE